MCGNDLVHCIYGLQVFAFISALSWMEIEVEKVRRDGWMGAWMGYGNYEGMIPT